MSCHASQTLGRTLTQADIDFAVRRWSNLSSPNSIFHVTPSEATSASIVFHFSSNLLICLIVIKANSIFPAVFLGPKTGGGSLNPRQNPWTFARRHQVRQNKYFIHIANNLFQTKNSERCHAMCCACPFGGTLTKLLASAPSSRKKWNEWPAKSRKAK